MTAKARGFHAGLVLTAVLATAVCGHTQVALTWEDVLEQPEAFYTTARARAIAAHVRAHQRPSGGWPKDIDMTVPPPAATPPARPDATIDNGATTTQIRYLATVHTASGTRASGPDAQAAVRGIDYLFASQYANGGWPQFFPLRKDYSRYITFNDNAMMNVMNLLDDVSAGKPPFTFVDAERRARARAAVDRGVALILETQLTIDGTLTAWAAQYDEVTLEPRSARAFEHASLSGSETVGIVRFLMRRPPAPAIVRAVDAAVSWLQRVRLPDGRWARFYEFRTNRPIFSGRDGVVRYSVEEIEAERREGYAWFGTWPRKLVEQEYPNWKKRLAP